MQELMVTFVNIVRNCSCIAKITESARRKHNKGLYSGAVMYRASFSSRLPPALLCPTSTGNKMFCSTVGGANHQPAIYTEWRGGCCLPSNTGWEGEEIVYVHTGEWGAIGL